MKGYVPPHHLGQDAPLPPPLLASVQRFSPLPDSPRHPITPSEASSSLSSSSPPVSVFPPTITVTTMPAPCTPTSSSSASLASPAGPGSASGSYSSSGSSGGGSGAWTATLERFFSGVAAGEPMEPLVDVLAASVDDYARASSSSSSSPSGRSSASSPSRLERQERRRFWGASKAAFLFSAECPAAAEAATRLYFSPSLRAVLRRLPPAGGALHSPLFAVGATPAEMQWGARALCAEARRCLRQGEWEAGLAVLRGAEAELQEGTATVVDDGQSVVGNGAREVAALGVELCAAGGRWAEALAFLTKLPVDVWTENDVAACVRAVYRHARALPSPSAEAPAQGQQRELLAQALSVAAAAADSIAWSSPGLLNDLLGLVALTAPDSDAGGADKTAARGGHEREETAHSLRVRETEALVAALLPENSDGMETIAGARSGPTPPPHPADSECMSTSDGLGGASVPPLSSLTTAAEAVGVAMRRSRVRLNAVTVFQVCCCLRARPAAAVRCAGSLARAHGVALLQDDGALAERYLRACVACGGWTEALEALRSPAPAREGVRHRDAESRSATRMALPPHPRADTLLALLRLLKSSGCDGETAELLATPVPGSGGRSLSKWFNPDARSRALNTLVQYSRSAAEAAPHLRTLHETLQHRYPPPAPSPQRQGDQTTDNSTRVCVPQAGAAAGKEEEEEGERLLAAVSDALENESHAQLVSLYAREGRWRCALRCFDTLLRDPRRASLYVPTARAHDSVQYALLQAPPPGPSWEVAVGLFTRACERQIPLSDVSYQSAAQLCRRHGVPDRAQELLRYVLRAGVR